MDLAIIADDLTGGILIAASIEASGIACPVVLGATSGESDGAAPAVVFATRTRFAPAAEAVATVAGILDRLAERPPVPQVAYKVCASFDSTDEGNIGPVADLLLERFGDAPLLMSAGYPKYATTVHQGYLFYGGRLVSESTKRHDPLTPMTDPDLVRTISRQTRHAIGLVPHGVLKQGASRAAEAVEALRAEGKALVLFDCSDDDDARIGAEVTLQRRATIGSDAHLMALADVRLKGAARPAPPRPAHARGPAAAIFGSVGPVADAQVAAFERSYPLLRIDLLDHRPVEALVEDALQWAAGRIGATPLGFTTAPATEAGVTAAQAAFGILGAARRAEAILAGVASGLVERGVRRLAVSGGETSGAVAMGLGIVSLRTLPDAGFGGGLCIATDPRPLSLFFKSGKLGGEDAMLRALAAMCN